MAMKEITPFNESEIIDLKEKIEKIILDLDENPDKVDFFYQHPIIFIRQYDIKIFDFIRKDYGLRLEYVHTIRRAILTDRIQANDRLKTMKNPSAIKYFKSIINKCFICKLSVLLLILAILGKSGIALWEMSRWVFEKVLEYLKILFEGTGELIDDFIEKFDLRLSKMRIPDFALLICRHLKYCPEIKEA